MQICTCCNHHGFIHEKEDYENIANFPLYVRRIPNFRIFAWRLFLNTYISRQTNTKSCILQSLLDFADCWNNRLYYWILLLLFCVFSIINLVALWCIYYVKGIYYFSLYYLTVFSFIRYTSSFWNTILSVPVILVFCQSQYQLILLTSHLL